MKLEMESENIANDVEKLYRIKLSFVTSSDVLCTLPKGLTYWAYNLNLYEDEESYWFDFVPGEFPQIAKERLKEFIDRSSRLWGVEYVFAEPYSVLSGVPTVENILKHLQIMKHEEDQRRAGRPGNHLTTIIRTGQDASDVMLCVVLYHSDTAHVKNIVESFDGGAMEIANVIIDIPPQSGSISGTLAALTGNVGLPDGDAGILSMAVCWNEKAASRRLNLAVTQANVTLVERIIGHLPKGQHTKIVDVVPGYLVKLREEGSAGLCDFMYTMSQAGITVVSAYTGAIDYGQTRTFFCNAFPSKLPW